MTSLQQVKSIKPILEGVVEIKNINNKNTIYEITLSKNDSVRYRNRRT